MAFYETIFIARQEIAPTQVETLTQQIIDILRQQGGDVQRVEYWGLRNLQYRIKKNKKGHYVFLNVSASAAALQEVERNLRLNEDVLRYMSVTVEVLNNNPSAMMIAKADKGARELEIASTPIKDAA